MRIIAVYIIDTEHRQFMHRVDLSVVSYFHRSAVQELLKVAVIAGAETLPDFHRKIFEHDDVMVLSYRLGSRVCSIVTDKEYPSRVSFNLLQRIHNDPTEAYLEVVMKRFQNPSNVDLITSVREKLDETLVVMHENVNLILQRGEDLDSLVERSKELSSSSKQFYKVARKHNRCCYIQ